MKVMDRQWYSRSDDSVTRAVRRSKLWVFLQPGCGHLVQAVSVLALGGAKNLDLDQTKARHGFVEVFDGQG